MKKQTVFHTIGSVIRNNPKSTLFMLLFDGLFVISLIAFASFFNLIMPQPGVIHSAIQSMNVRFLIAYSSAIFYLFVILLIYTFFKSMVLMFLHNLDHKSFKVKKGYWKLAVVNVAYALIFVALFFIIDGIIRLLNPAIAQIAAIVLTTLFVLVSYSIISIGHSIYTTKLGYKTILKSMKLALKIKNYWRLYIPAFVIFASYYILYLMVGYAIADNLDPYQLQFVVGPVVGGITILLTYIIHFLTRIAFFDKFAKH